MKPEFSEFSYGFAICREITNGIRATLLEAPLFPSLRKEKELGYDVKFVTNGRPLYLQFKLANYMKGTQSTYKAQYGGQSYFQIALYKQCYSNQHNILRSLSITTNEPEVYYVAPAFYRLMHFNNAFQGNEIISRSVFIPVANLPGILSGDNTEHHITYTNTLPFVNNFGWHSNEGTQFHHTIDGKQWLAHIKDIQMHPQDLGENYFLRLRNALLHIVEEQSLQKSLFNGPILQTGKLDIVLLLQEIHDLLANYFGAVLVILQPPSATDTSTQ